MSSATSQTSIPPSCSRLQSAAAQQVNISQSSISWQSLSDISDICGAYMQVLKAASFSVPKNQIWSFEAYFPLKHNVSVSCAAAGLTDSEETRRVWKNCCLFSGNYPFLGFLNDNLKSWKSNIRLWSQSSSASLGSVVSFTPSWAKFNLFQSPPAQTQSQSPKSARFMLCSIFQLHKSQQMPW